MTLCVTTKHYQITDSLLNVVEKSIEKIGGRIPHLNPNLGLIKVLIRWNKRRSFFDGSVSFSVPKKHLYTYFQGAYPDEALRSAFERLSRELSKYKGKHFTNDSQYPNRETIRQTFVPI